MVLVDSTLLFPLVFFFLNAPATTEIYTLSLHDALPICERNLVAVAVVPEFRQRADGVDPLEEPPERVVRRKIRGAAGARGARGPSEGVEEVRGDGADRVGHRDEEAVLVVTRTRGSAGRIG